MENTRKKLKTKIKDNISFFSISPTTLPHRPMTICMHLADPLRNFRGGITDGIEEETVVVVHVIVVVPHHVEWEVNLKILLVDSLRYVDVLQSSLWAIPDHRE